MNSTGNFTRKIVSIINFDLNTFFDSDHYKEFIKENPHLKDNIDDTITKFIEWAKSTNGVKDLSLTTSKNPDFSDYLRNIVGDIPFKYNWCINDYHNVDLDDFKNQMGTTLIKFSLTENTGLPNNTVKLIANVFNDIGFTTFVAEFSPYYNCKRFDCTFTLLRDYIGTVHDSNPIKSKYRHICVAIPDPKN